MTAAWAVQGGAADPQAARAFAFMATGGAFGAGVAEHSHLKVVADGTPIIKIMPGAAAIPSRYNSATSFETYTVAAETQRSVNVPATGSGGGQVRYVILRIDDPNHGGQAPTGGQPEYWSPQLVPTLAGIDYPYLELGKITQPPSTSNITQAMIEDLRVMSNERSEQKTVVHYPTTTIRVSQSDSGNSWVNLGESVPVKIPEWATHATLIARYDGLFFNNGPMAGHLNTHFAGQNNLDVGIDVETTASTRHSSGTADNLVIPANLRGQTSVVEWQARRQTGSGYMAVFNNRTNLSATVTFEQRPV